MSCDRELKQRVHQAVEGATLRGSSVDKVKTMTAHFDECAEFMQAIEQQILDKVPVDQIQYKGVKFTDALVPGSGWQGMPIHPSWFAKKP